MIAWMLSLFGYYHKSRFVAEQYDEIPHDIHARHERNVSIHKFVGKRCMVTYASSDGKDVFVTLSPVKTKNNICGWQEFIIKVQLWKMLRHATKRGAGLSYRPI